MQQEITRATRRKRSGAVVVHRTRTTVDDARLSVLSAGPTGGEPVLLLHGIPTGAELWRDTLLHLGAAGYWAFAPDLPGYGETRLPAGADYSLDGAADLLIRWLRRTGRPPLWVVGHDLGGGIAQIMAARVPALFSRLTLCNTVFADSWPVPPIRRLRLLARLGLYPALARLGFIDSAPLWYVLRRALVQSQRLTADDLRHRVFFDSIVHEPGGRQAFAAHLRALDPRQTMAATPHLRALRAPVLLVWGLQDRYIPWDSAGPRLQELFPTAATALLPDAGHFVMLDQPDRFVDALLAWRQLQASVEN